MLRTGSNSEKPDTPRTNNHGGELKPFPHALPVDLVGEIGKPDVAHELLANDVGNASGVASWDERRARTIGNAMARGIAIARRGVGVGHLSEYKREEGKERTVQVKKYFKVGGS
jgi:hypothetical protein